MGFDIKRISINSVKEKITNFTAAYDDKIRTKAARSGLSEFIGLTPTTTWRLRMLDPPYTAFVGQFVADNLVEAAGCRIADKASLNKQDTEKVWLGGESNTLSFTTRVWATSTVKSVREPIQQLKSFTKRDDKLKRAPMFVFTSGTDLRFNVFVKSVGGIEYDRPRSDGTIRGATFSMTMLIIEGDIPSEQNTMSLSSLVETGLGIITSSSLFKTLSSFINVPGGSLHLKGKKVIVKDGQTFEHIAQQEYGDASVGDILRRVHYDNPRNTIKNSLEVGDYIDLVHESDIFSIKVTPQSIALKSDKVNIDNIKSHFALRSGERTIYPSA
jgi:hypothetical protein